MSYAVKIETIKAIVQSTKLIPDLANLVFGYYEIFPDVLLSVQILSQRLYYTFPGEKEFAIIPARDINNDLFWFLETGDCLDLFTDDEKVKTIAREHKISVSSFIASSSLGFDSIIGKWGWDVFEWMEKRGYVEESKLIKENTVDNAADRFHKVLYQGVQDPVLELYRKEQQRILSELQIATRKIWIQLHNSGWALDLNTLYTVRKSLI